MLCRKHRVAAGCSFTGHQNKNQCGEPDPASIIWRRHPKTHVCLTAHRLLILACRTERRVFGKRMAGLPIARCEPHARRKIERRCKAGSGVQESACSPACSCRLTAAIGRVPSRLNAISFAACRTALIHSIRGVAPSYTLRTPGADGGRMTAFLTGMS